MKKAIFTVSVVSLVSVFCFTVLAVGAAAPVKKSAPAKKVVTQVKKAVAKKAPMKKKALRRL